MEKPNFYDTEFQLPYISSFKRNVILEQARGKNVQNEIYLIITTGKSISFSRKSTIFFRFDHTNKEHKITNEDWIFFFAVTEILSFFSKECHCFSLNRVTYNVGRYITCSMWYMMVTRYTQLPNILYICIWRNTLTGNLFIIKPSKVRNEVKQ